MGGGNRKKFNKSRCRTTSLFVQGGDLADWSSPSFVPHSPPGRIFSGGHGKGKPDDASRSRKGKGKQGSSSASGSGYGSISGGDHVKSKGNSIGYVYPRFNSQDNMIPNLDEEKGKDLESQPMILLDSKETPIIAYADEVPNKNTPCSEYAYDYTAGFTLDESSHRGLRINHGAKESTACSGFTCETEKKESSSKASTPAEGPEQNILGSDYVSGYIKDFTLDEGCHRGLGFHDEAKESLASLLVACKLEDKSGFIESSPSNEDEVMVEDSGHSDTSAKVEDDILGTPSSHEINAGFLCIAGRRIYTHDISDSESDEVEFLDEESSDCSETEDSSDPSDSDTDIDDVIAEDYIQGIGGCKEFVNIDQLIGMVPTVDEDSDSSDGFDKTVEKLGGIALQDASKEYGMKKLQPARKTYGEADKLTPGTYDMLSAMDDFMLMKDPRNVYGRKKHTKRTPQSWPIESRKSQNGRKIPGEKKKHRKEMIAVKRRERMIRRGVDLQHINSKLQQLVMDGGDILSFQPMHTRDCSKVQKLAAMYRLRSASQGSGKKKFVTVTRTTHTCMPSSADRLRLEKFIGNNDEDGDFAVCDVRSVEGGKKTKKATRHNTDTNIKKLRADLRKKKKCRETISYAAQPVSFVSSGVMSSDVVLARTLESSETNETCRDSEGMPSSHAYGSFELHTTGFGSKMMAKMGYIEGRGLGKEGQGMAEPIEVFQRPKSLGLGADMPESLSVGREHPSRTVGKDNKRKGKRECTQFGAFEKYTTGFGSRMMAKMGFVEGTGLGKDSQGMVAPLAAVRRPKSQGLGAKQ